MGVVYMEESVKVVVDKVVYAVVLVLKINLGKSKLVLVVVLSSIGELVAMLGCQQPMLVKELGLC